MNFEQRARKARQRGQSVRAAVLLIEGLKRHLTNDSALGFLVQIYVEDLTSPGLGYDLAGILLSQPDAQSCFEELLWQLHERGKDSMGREIVRAAAEDGVELIWPPPHPTPAPVEAEAPSEDALAESAEAEGPPAEAAHPITPDPPDAPSQISEETLLDGGQQAAAESAEEPLEPYLSAKPASSPDEAALP